MLFKLGICPIEIFNTKVQKLKYAQPAPIQELETFRWDYYARNDMFIGSRKTRHLLTIPTRGSEGNNSPIVKSMFKSISLGEKNIAH